MRLFIIFILILLVGGGLIWGYRSYAKTVQEWTYVTAKIEQGKLEKYLSTTGKIKAVKSVDVGSQVSGQISHLFVDFNDVVKQDQPIAQLDQQSFIAEQQVAQAELVASRSNVAISRAGLERAKSVLQSEMARRAVVDALIEREQALHTEANKALQREQSLSAKKLSSSEKLEKARSDFARTLADLHQAEAEKIVQEHKINTAAIDLKQAEAELINAQSQIPQREAVLKLASIKLERTVIRSPIDGIVIDRKIDSGQTVAASLEAPRLFTIAQNLAEMEVHAQVDEADIGKIETSQTISFTVDAYPDKNFSGHVIQIRKSPETRNNVVSYKVVIATKNPDLVLLPGMTALVRITVYESGEVLLIPNRALHFQPANADLPAINANDQATVWKLTGANQLEAVHIQTGENNYQHTELINGALQEGDLLVIEQQSSATGNAILDFAFWKK